MTTQQRQQRFRRVPSWCTPTLLVLSLDTFEYSVLFRRRSHRRGASYGSCWYFDDRPTPPRDPDSRKKKKVVPRAVGECENLSRHRRMAEACLVLLRKDRSAKGALKALPLRIPCGQLRSAIRSTFPPDIDPVLELSIKSAQKLETSWCPTCESAFGTMLKEWKEARFFPVPRFVGVDYLIKLKKVLGFNIPTGWNLRRYPYVPTGNATLWSGRPDGGSWTSEPPSVRCRVMMVVSSGKPRVVTAYSSGVSQVLSPLHRALMSHVKGKEWLLVGPPTTKQVSSLNGGDYVSVDYQSATDNVYTEVVATAVELLLERAVGLSDTEADALRSVAALDFGQGPVDRGQPMGSLMSFPLLCLLNKAVFDLAIGELLEEGKISYETFSQCRCLINGDDLLFRQPYGLNRQAVDLLSKVRVHGARVGFVINTDKTMVSPVWAEVNSTAFFRGKYVKKTNLAALRMRECADVLGEAAKATVTLRGLRHVLLRNRRALSHQRIKVQSGLTSLGHPAASVKKLLRSKELRPALTTRPTRAPEAENPLSVVTMPDGYFLSRDKEVEVINREVEGLMSRGWVPPRLDSRVSEWEPLSLTKALKTERKGIRTRTLRCLADAWGHQLLTELGEIEAEPVLTELVYDGPAAFGLVDAIRAFRETHPVRVFDALSGGRPRSFLRFE